MALLSRRRAAWAAAIGLAAACGIGVAASHALRDSMAAAYRAFRDPSRVRPKVEHGDIELPEGPVTELEQPEISLDFEHATDDDLGDAGACAASTDAGACARALDALTLPDLPIPVSRRTVQFVAYFAASEAGRKAFIERLRRGGRYKDRIEQALRDAQVPEDLVWLVAIESAFNPQAVSPKGATGLFQFMPETAEKYGLAMDDWIDERRGIARASAAGAQHLRDLFDHFERWDLALAAYNFGKEPLDEAIEKLRSRRGEKGAGKPVEFKDLAEARLIPKETANFVPQVQAFAIVAANRGRFGLDDLDVAAPFQMGEMAVPAGTPLALIAKAAGVSITTVRDFNPELLRDRAPPGGDAIVYVPADRIERAVVAFPALYARAMPAPSGPAEPPRAPDKGASSSASNAPLPSASAPGQPAAAPAMADSHPPSLAHDFTLDDGVHIEVRESAAANESISAHVEALEPSRSGLRAKGRAWDVPVTSVAPRDLSRGFSRAAEAVEELVRPSGEAAAELRRALAEPSRAALEKVPYGAGWLSLGDALYGGGARNQADADHSMAGAVLAAPLLPLASILVAEAPRGAFLVTVHAEGPAPREKVDVAARASFGSLFNGNALGLDAPHASDERLSATSPVTSPRLFMGWIAPPQGGAEEAPLRLALVLLANNKNGKLAHALVEKKIATHLRGTLDLGELASVLAIEVEPAVPHEPEEVIRELDKVLNELAAHGPSMQELAGGKELLRVYLKAERAHPGRVGEPKEAHEAHVDAVLARAEDASPNDVQALVSRALSPDHRVVVTVSPRR